MPKSRLLGCILGTLLALALGRSLGAEPGGLTGPPNGRIEYPFGYY